MAEDEVQKRLSVSGAMVKAASKPEMGSLKI
jgi:hypothetical protein